MDGRNPPLTPSSAEAWKKLNAIHSAQDRDISSHGHTADGGGGNNNSIFEGGLEGVGGGGHGGRRPAPVAVGGGGGGGAGGLHRELMKNKMDKLTGGQDPREPLAEAPRTPIGPGHKQYAEDLPRTPSSMDAWQTLNRIAAAQERQAHHPTPQPGDDDLSSPEDIPWDPREPDQPRTPVHHGHVGGGGAGGDLGALARPLFPMGAANKPGGQAASSSVRVHIRVERMTGTKSMHDPIVEIDLLDDTRTSLHHTTSTPGATSANNHHTWQPPAHFTIAVPLPLVNVATLRFHVVGKKLIGHRDGGELFVPVRSLPITHSPPVEHAHTLLRQNGETAGTIELAAYREG